MSLDIPGDHAFTADSPYGAAPMEYMYAGALSFMRRPYSRDLSKADLAITGVPFDTATTNRPGARFGPRAVRAASTNIAWARPWPWEFDPFEKMAVVDYGDWRSLGDTWQALADGRLADPLASAGRADLTAHVDFEVLAQATADVGAAHTRLTPQGVFLERLGITQRAERLAAGLSGAALETHIAAHRRLTAPDEMGTLFKAMAIHPKGSALPAGFAP